MVQGAKLKKKTKSTNAKHGKTLKQSNIFLYIRIAQPQ